MSDKRITPVKDWPEAERPRERLISHGPAALSEAQLLAIIIRNGRAGRTPLDLGRDLLERFGSLSGIEQAGISEICAVPGIGKAKAAEIKAAIELGRRHQKPSLAGASFCSSDDVASYYRPRMKDLKKESFGAPSLTQKTRSSVTRLFPSAVSPYPSFIPATLLRPRSGSQQQRSSLFTIIPAATPNRARKTFCLPGGSFRQERSWAFRCSTTSSSETAAISAFGKAA